jgi:hypothetical protein
MYQDTSTNHTIFKKWNLNSNALITTLTSTQLYGELDGRHSLASLPNGNLLTVNRSTHDMVELSEVDLSVVRTYGLNINPLDGWINFAGDAFCYMDGTVLQQWDLTNDAPAAGIKDFGVPVIMPIWTSNNAFIVYTGDFNSGGTGNVIRIDSGGTVLNTYTGATFSSSSGVRGIACSVLRNLVYIMAMQGTEAAVAIFTMNEGVYAGTFAVTGPLDVTYPGRDTAAAFCGIYEPTITAFTFDCSTREATITGAAFPANPQIIMKFNGSDFTDFAITTVTPTQILLQITNFQSGVYAVSVS